MSENHRLTPSAFPTAVYVWAGGEVVANVTAGYYYFHDGRGNVSHLSDSSNILIERYTYDLNGTVSYFDRNGNPMGASVVQNRFLFAGAILLPETSFYDMRNRIYSSHWGRFLQTDPIGFKGDADNLFRYCDDDPVDRSDPMGLLSTASGSTIEERMRLFYGSGRGSLYGLDHREQVSFTMAPITPIPNRKDKALAHAELNVKDTIVYNRTLKKREIIARMGGKWGNNSGAFTAPTFSPATIGERNGKPFISGDVTLTVYLPNDVDASSHEYQYLYKTEQDSVSVLRNVAGATSLRMNELVANEPNAEAARLIFDSRVRPEFDAERVREAAMPNLIGTHRDE